MNCMGENVMRIVIVEDEVRIREGFFKLLGKLGRQQVIRNLLITSYRSSTTSRIRSRFRLNTFLLLISRNSSRSELQQESFLTL